MSCGCNNNPCNCTSAQPPVCGGRRTKCDLYRTGDKNVWVEKGPNLGDEERPGICLLDTMSDEQVIYVVERDDKARADLFKVTSDAHLRNLAENISRLPTQQDDDRLQSDMNRNHAPASNPFYALFRGQPPFAQ
jgi:hypothetical protein